MKLTQKAVEEFRSVYGRIPAGEIPAAHDRLRRYVQLAITVSQADEGRRTEAPLTREPGGGRLISGPVEPRTFTNTG